MESPVHDCKMTLAARNSGEFRDSGVYFPEAARQLIYATDASIWRGQIPFADRHIRSWSGRGYFRLYEPDFGGIRFSRRSKFLSFLGLVSVRMIAIMRSFAIRWKEIKRAYEYVRQLSGQDYPLATRPFWTDDADNPSNVYAEIDQIKLAANLHGQTYFGDLRKTKIVPSSGLIFEGENAAIWRPADGVWINPQYQNGVPCVDGTRIPTSVLWAFQRDGMRIGEIAEEFELSDTHVEEALAWQSKLAEVVS